MGRTVFLVENFWNRMIFPDHVLTSSNADDAAGAWGSSFVGTARRQVELNRWESDTANADAYLQCTMDRVRAFDMLVIDRDHNLGGYPVQVRVSADGFTTWNTISATIPTQVFPQSLLDPKRPVLTEEGAVLWYLGPQLGKAVKLFVPAMGAGLAPRIVGAYTGQRFALTHARKKPYSFGKVRTVYQRETSPQAWSAAGEIGRLRVDSIGIRLASRQEYQQARYHIEHLYFEGRVAWIIHDDEEAEKSLLAKVPPGDAGFSIESGDWSEFQGEIPYEEHEPRFIQP